MAFALILLPYGALADTLLCTFPEAAPTHENQETKKDIPKQSESRYAFTAETPFAQGNRRGHKLALDVVMRNLNSGWNLDALAFFNGSVLRILEMPASSDNAMIFFIWISPDGPRRDIPARMFFSGTPERSEFFGPYQRNGLCQFAT